MSAFAVDPDGVAGSTPAVLRRGFAAIPEIRDGLALTLVLALVGGFGRLAIPVLVQQLLDRGLSTGHIDVGHLVRLGALAGVAVVGTAVVNWVSLLRLAIASERALCGLRIRAFGHVHRLSVAYHSAETRGKLVSRVTSDVGTLSQFLQWGGIAWVVNGAAMLAALIGMLYYDVWLTLVTVALIVPMVVLIHVLTGRLGPAHSAVRGRVADLLTVTSETIQGAAVIRAYGITKPSLRRTTATIHRWRDAKARAGYLGSVLFSLAELFAAIVVVGVVAVGLAIGPSTGHTAGDLVAFLLLVTLFLGPVGQFTQVIDFTQNAVAGWRRVLALLDIVEDVTEPVDGRQLPASPPAVVVQNVTFGYPNAGTALTDVSFEVPAGRQVVLVGATGSGKTTLTKLIARLADPDRGHILIGGVDTREIATESLRSRVVVVPQEPFLFDTTVEENVRYGRPSATRADVERAFHDLGAGAFLAGLPRGLDTPVGQRGESLSAGERQLVALARAHLADPACLILDEATSAVDPRIELTLIEALRRLTAGRTSLTVAHRLATAERADEVIVLDGGRLVERGRHDELLAAGGVYTGLYDSWRRSTAAGTVA
ncbi:multidrug ABC transporter ATP-binding protein [Actinoplanes ianthinogenes]|uniref:Multidrug ABC transporter ATP-binding protein n=1 Tax=Actinoplanes ianthinogenes TaxID=122358 RepID=A0ABM7LYT6_9ACTN|nr:ABC transporter ATP-binding protein [Actinoplanes ianthinogenes]BCJ44495.1 multidrug ABC transporter ATP-binding protein [Actinoplanes ianthinogenes]GGQ98326.1 multidrug ABC transporter ATP-binding protein [Actinoplanes ianthinogenes]